ncbi:MAG TPA: hypothetical protein PLX66_02615 [Bacilli bacterium]|nr:hypothetical protein [Bacilli bacterium]
MKKIIIGIVEGIISLLITFTTFYLMSWYSFETLPTKIVLIRMVICFVFIFTIMFGITYLILKNKKDNNKQ